MGIIRLNMSCEAYENIKTLNKYLLLLFCLPECQDRCHGIKRFSTGTVDKAKEQHIHLSSVILHKNV